LSNIPYLQSLIIGYHLSSLSIPVQLFFTYL
jgi:hypothetical protein